MESVSKTADIMNVSNIRQLDVLVVGAGFGGCYQLKRFRDEGYTVKLLETGKGYGGVWYWNAYPGARVDTTTPLYEFDDPALWRDWTWKQKFPDHNEIRSYFEYVADKWDLRKDTLFNRFVSSAHWNAEMSRWIINTREGETYEAKYLSLNVGFAAKHYIPDWKMNGVFKGVFIHPSCWPHEGIDLKNKKIAVIGTGSTGVQLATELARVSSQLTVFQRSINTCIPMGQVNYHNGEQTYPRGAYPDIFERRLKSFSGFDFNFINRKTFDDNVAVRRETYEKLWSEGTFKFWLATYMDMLFDPEANREAYNFWRDKTRDKINDARLRDILAPLEQPYSFGCKRISLEQGYFEIFNEPHVHLVNINEERIEEITERGIRTSKEEYEFDIIICATGYDAVTGGLSQIDIRGLSKDSLQDHWKDGVHTNLGMTVSDFPNMFMTYAPQGPTALCNGPTCAQVQGDWILNAVKKMKEKGFKTMTADKQAEKEWRETIMRFAYASLLPGTKSWYMGDNVPGKPREPLIYLGGLPKYYETISDVAAHGYTGFCFGN